MREESVDGFRQSGETAIVGTKVCEGEACTPATEIAGGVHRWQRTDMGKQ